MAKISVSIRPVSSSKKGFRKIVYQKLNSYNKKKVGRFNWRDLDIEATNAKGKCVGGLLSGTYWGWLFVKMLWVEEKHREQGIGTQLLQKAEDLAVKRGCKYVHLDTFSFQAPEFYRKLGFKRFGSLKPFPKGSKRYFLYKRIK
jgi:ribosomal protein S18 acetylase RimI-like enzyme